MNVLLIVCLLILAVLLGAAVGVYLMARMFGDAAERIVQTRLW